MTPRRKHVRPLLPFLALLAFLPPAAATAAPPAPPPVLVATVASPISPVTADYLDSVVDRAEEEGAALLVLELDTPGGLDTAMRQMVQSILRSRVPIAVYVYPSGARAASAGVLITIAADVAAMAPGTNIGAAHPVSVGGGPMDNTMSRKAENDAAAYARSLAESRGRNADWAESAVRESASLSEKQALSGNVVDLVAPNLDSLLAQADGREVKREEFRGTLRTKGARVVRAPMGLRHRILAALADPNIAYILMMIGIYGIFFELSNPGAVFPGVVGGISLILGFYALQTLSANYAGFLLILLAVILFILEIKITSYGALTIGGVIALVLGSVMLFRASGDPFLRVSWTVLITMVAVSAVFFGGIVSLAVRSQLRKPVSGPEGMIGTTGEALADFDGTGKVRVLGELWDARCDVPLRKGDRVVVKTREGMTLVVAKDVPPAPRTT